METDPQIQMQFTIFTPIAIKAVSEIHTQVQLEATDFNSDFDSDYDNVFESESLDFLCF